MALREATLLLLARPSSRRRLRGKDLDARTAAKTADIA